MERLRRQKSAMIPNMNELENHTIIPYLQEKFLSNDSNKNKLIKILMEELGKFGFTCKQAVEDADTLIIMTAISIAAEDKTIIVVGQDIDLLVLLNQLNEENLDILFQKPLTGNTPNCFYSSNSYEDESKRKYVAFIHCFTGCDTTSGCTGKGKITAVRALLNYKDFAVMADSFYEKNSSKTLIAQNGCKLMASMYNKKKNDVTLHDLRYQIYKTATIKSNFKLEKLPPTAGAAEQHCYRVYYQLQTWLGNELTATDWGWKISSDGIMKPCMTTEKLIPDNLLKTICCSCEKGCLSAKCSCRKHGLRCTDLCSNCNELGNCTNLEVLPVIMDDSDSEEVEEPHTAHEDNEDEEIDEETVSSAEIESDEEESSYSAKRARFEII